MKMLRPYAWMATNPLQDIFRSKNERERERERVRVRDNGDDCGEKTL